MGMSSFKVVYEVKPLSPLNLTPWPIDQKDNVDTSKRVREIQELHERVKGEIEQANAFYLLQTNKHLRQVILNPGIEFGCTENIAFPLQAYV